MKTFSALKTELRAIIFPAGEASNLVAAHDHFFLDALIDLQTFVECLQQDNTSVFPQCSTFYNCGLTVIDAPRGNIKKVGVIGSTSEDAVDWCSEAEYLQVSPVAIREYLNRSVQCGYCLPTFFSLIQNSCIKGYYPAPTDADVPAGLPILPLGYHYPQTSTDNTYGRAMHGFWGIERGKIFIAPYIQSDEHVSVKWDGIKRTWTEADIIDEDPMLASALMEYVRWQHADKYEKDEAEAVRAMGAYNNWRTLLMHQCREENRVRDREPSYARSATGISGNGVANLYYNEVQTFTASCQDGETGNDVTVTIPAGAIASTYSVADANQKALNEAQIQAESRLDCESETVSYTNDAQTATAACQAGDGAPTPTGAPVIVTIPAGTVSSTVSKADANQQALALAESEAASQLVCVWKNAAQTATVHCESNEAQEFSATVAAGTYTSSVSQDDANAQAMTDATNQAIAARDTSGLCGADPVGVWNTVQTFWVNRFCQTGHGSIIKVLVTVPANTIMGDTQLEANSRAVQLGNQAGNAYAEIKCNLGLTGSFNYTYGDPIT